MRFTPLIVAAVSASAALFAAVPASASTAVPNASSLTSNVWAGWMDLANSGVQIYDVTARFTVPKTTCTATNEKAAIWVGLDGWTDGTVEQTGVDAVCVHTSSGYKMRYYAYYEMFPNKPVPKHLVPMGDTIVASVSYNTDGKYSLEIDDKTHPGDGLNASASCPRGHTCRKNSAEVIVEDPAGGAAKHTYLANFGTVRLSQVEVISRSGTIGTLAGNAKWTANEITMEYPHTTKMARTSARTNGDTAFSVTYRSRG